MPGTELYPIKYTFQRVDIARTAVARLPLRQLGFLVNITRLDLSVASDSRSSLQKSWRVPRPCLHWRHGCGTNVVIISQIYAITCAV